MEPNLKELLKKRLLEKTALEQTYESDAGTILRGEMADRITGIVYTLAGNYKTLSHPEMIALCAQIDAIIQTSSLLKDAHLVVKDLKEQLEE